jgi:hypothetical protein
MEPIFVLTLVGLGSVPKYNCLKGFTTYNFEKNLLKSLGDTTFQKKKPSYTKTILVIFLLNFQ